MKTELFLHEEVMLLALSNDRGTIETGTWYQQAVGGAVLSELLLGGRVKVRQRGKKSLIEVLDTDRVGDRLVDEWLGEMGRSPEPRKLRHWLSKIANSKDLKGRIARGLVERGILEQEEGKVLFLFNRTRYPEADRGPELEIRNRLRDAILTDTSEVDARTVALLSIAKGTGILARIFDKKELARRKRRIERLVEGEITGPAVAELIQEINAAIMVACVVPVIAS